MNSVDSTQSDQAAAPPQPPPSTDTILDCDLESVSKHPPGKTSILGTISGSVVLFLGSVGWVGVCCDVLW